MVTLRKIKIHRLTDLGDKETIAAMNWFDVIFSQMILTFESDDYRTDGIIMYNNIHFFSVTEDCTKFFIEDEFVWELINVHHVILYNDLCDIVKFKIKEQFNIDVIISNDTFVKGKYENWFKYYINV